MKKKSTNNLDKLISKQSDIVECALFTGNILGNQSLIQAIEIYKEKGIYHPCRRDLIEALKHSLEELIILESYVIAKGHTP